MIDQYLFFKNPDFNPYILMPENPSGFYVDEKVCLPGILELLTSPEYNQHHLDGGFKQYFFNYRCSCVEEFYRQKIDGTFAGLKLPTVHRSVVKVEVNLWLKTYSLIEEVYKRSKITYQHPALCFYDIVRERKLVLFRFFQNEENLNKEDWITIFRSQNQRLLTIEKNPFDRQTARYTWELTEKAMRLAEQEDLFRRKFYTPLVKARQAVTTKVAAPESDLSIKGEEGLVRKNMGGRKPKKKAKNNTASKNPSGKGFQE